MFAKFGARVVLPLACPIKTTKLFPLLLPNRVHFPTEQITFFNSVPVITGCSNLENKGQITNISTSTLIFDRKRTKIIESKKKIPKKGKKAGSKSADRLSKNNHDLKTKKSKTNVTKRLNEKNVKKITKKSKIKHKVDKPRNSRTEIQDKVHVFDKSHEKTNTVENNINTSLSAEEISTKEVKEGGHIQSNEDREPVKELKEVGHTLSNEDRESVRKEVQDLVLTPDKENIDEKRHNLAISKSKLSKNKDHNFRDRKVNFKEEGSLEEIKCVYDSLLSDNNMPLRGNYNVVSCKKTAAEYDKNSIWSKITPFFNLSYVKACCYRILELKYSKKLEEDSDIHHTSVQREKFNKLQTRLRYGEKSSGDPKG